MHTTIRSPRRKNITARSAIMEMETLGDHMFICSSPWMLFHMIEAKKYKDVEVKYTKMLPN